MAKRRDEDSNKTRVYAPTSNGGGERAPGGRRAKPLFGQGSAGVSYGWVRQEQPENPLVVDLEEALEEELEAQKASAGGKAARKDKPAKKKKAKRKNARGKKKKDAPQRDWKNVLSWALAVITALGIMAALYFVFLLDTVVVEGNDLYADSSIAELSGLKANTHMMFCDIGAAAENIEQNPYLKVISVERSLPRTIIITVEERKEMAAIRSSAYDVIIDHEGHVLSIGSGSDLSGLINVYGISVTGFQVGKPIGESTDYRTNALLNIFAGLERLALTEQIAEIDLSNTMRVTFRTAEGITVLIGQPEGLDDKLEWMQDTLLSLRRSGVKDGMLDVSPRGGAIYSPAAQNDPVPEDDAPEDGTPEDDTPEDDTPEDGGNGAD